LTCVPMLPPPPSRPTLFPYTTLFRSFRINEAYFNLAKGPLFVRVGRQTISWGESDTIALLDQSMPFNLTMAQEIVCRPTRTKSGDRKSTRLNSSHLGISYAVFCLKKK